MNETSIDEHTLRSWAIKYISGPDDNGYILKKFKNDGLHIPYSFEEQYQIIRKKKQYFWKFIPETELIRNDDGSYCIKQKYIEWRLLKYTDINHLDNKILSDLLELFNWYIAFCKDEWMEIDVFWYQQDINNIENIRKRRIRYYIRMFNGFLSSTNIIISNDNRVYMIDVCDTIPIKKDNQKLRKIQRAIKCAIKWAIVELWVRRSAFKIRGIMEKKRNELLDALS